MKHKELIVALVVLGLLFALANPLDLYMLSMSGTMILGLLVVAFFSFVALVWRETHVSDERDLAHQALVGRIAYLTGASALLAAITIQSIQHALDITLVVVLAVMILAKIVGAAYVRTRW